ncbi:cytochrome P450 4V2 [Tetranychus urticae]|uniref:cytochrome P450 4V2 n=1 Tax=Tetranychus urticae TaxID=32264 RepID=UPI00077BA184|nr:cytochrome P450 4V2 [Tetranychus urticae]UQN24047.1 cytochrome P450 monooxygenase [Tetranychus cinnabarinus]
MLILDYIIYPASKLAIIWIIYKLLEISIRAYRLAAHYQDFPCEKSHWLFGDLLKIAPRLPKTDREEIASNVRKFIYRNYFETEKRNDILIAWMSWIPVVICSSHKTLEPIITKPETRKHHIYRWLGMRDGLVSSSGSKWKARRKIFEPLFASKQLSQFTTFIRSNTVDIVNSMESKCHQPINLSDYIHQLTMNSIFEAAFKLPPDSYKQQKKVLIEGIAAFEDSLMERICNPLYWSDWIFEQFNLGKQLNEVQKYGDVEFNKIINKRLQTNNNTDDLQLDGNQTRRDMIDLMFKHNNGKGNIDRSGMIEEMLTMVAAGHETIANSLSWLIFTLGNHPEIQDRIAEEINEVIGDLDDFSDLSILKQLVYMEQCIKESLRLVPPLPVVLRHLESDVQVGSKVLLKDSVVVLFILGAHHDPTVYPDPFTFNPDRFAPENIDSIPKYAFLPFGLGPRMCIGYRYAMMEIKIFLSQFLRRYRVKSCKTMEEVTYYIELITRPSCPLEVIISPREL